MNDDALIELRRLACNGSRSAAVFLKGFYKGKDRHQEFKYTCYAALAGDLPSAIELYDRDLDVLKGFADDDLERRNSHDPHLIPERMEIRSNSTLAFGHYSDWTKKDYGGLNEGYIHPDDAGYYEVLKRDTVDPSELIASIDRKSAERYPSKKKSPVDEASRIEVDGIYDPKRREKIFSELDDSETGRYWKAMFRYLGIGTYRNGDAALREMLDLSENGNSFADDAIVYMTGYQPESYRQRCPMYTEEDLKNMFDPDWPDDPRMYYYEVADRVLIEDSIEWEILSLLTGLYNECNFGYTDYEEMENEEGGYSDDVVYTRADNQSEPGPPTFVFKPSGYSMGWYKYAWRSPEQSENLSIGEILRIWRLCIEHILWGREIPKGTTREILDLPIYTAEVPDDLKDRIKAVFERAPCNNAGLVCITYANTFEEDDRRGSNENRAREILEGLQVSTHVTVPR